MHLKMIKIKIRRWICQRFSKQTTWRWDISISGSGGGSSSSSSRGGGGGGGGGVNTWRWYTVNHNTVTAPRLTEGREAVGLAGLGEGGVHAGLGEGGECPLAAVGRHRGAGEGEHGAHRSGGWIIIIIIIIIIITDCASTTKWPPHAPPHAYIFIKTCVIVLFHSSLFYFKCVYMHRIKSSV